MSLKPYIGFVGPSYISESKIAAFDRTVNYYPEQIESGTGTSRWVLYPTPGYVTNVTVPTSPGRAIFTLNGACYVVYGSALYTISNIVTLRAQGLSDISAQDVIASYYGNVAQIVGNGDAGHQLLIRADTTMYALDLNSPPSEVTFLDPPVTPLFAQNVDGANVAMGYYNYAVTFGISTGETTPGTRAEAFTTGPGGLLGGAFALETIPLGPSIVTYRRIWRTEVQANPTEASTAQLKLLGTIANNTGTQFADTFADASLGVNAPTVNTASITTDALTVIPFPANQIAYLDGYGIALDAANSTIRVSNLFNFAVWDDIDVAQRSDAADKWRAMLVAHKEIWLFGSETTSVYFNSFGPDSAATDFPFSPIPSVFVTMGIIAPLSACVVDGQPMWIGQGVNGVGVVYRANGYTPERISTHAVEYAINIINNSNVDALTLAEGSTYQENGHVFYVLTFPSGNGVSGQTWVYDATEGLWHERGQFNGLEFFELDVRGNAQINGAQYTTSRTTGKFYRQWINYSTGTDGLGVVRLRRAPHILSAQNRIRYARLRVLMETGITTIVSGIGSDPLLALRWSDDGGQTFGTTYTASVGVAGAYSTLVDFWQLGQGRDRIFEFRCSAPVPYRIIDCYLDYSVGPS